MPYVKPARRDKTPIAEGTQQTWSVSSNNSQYDGLLALAAATCRTSHALIDIFGVGLYVHSEQPTSVAPCFKPGDIYSLLTAGSELIVIGDANAELGEVAGLPHLYRRSMHFCAIKPLRKSDGSLVGTLCLLDYESRVVGLDPACCRAIAALGQQVETTLNLIQAITDRDRMITEQREMAEKLDWAATHDPLTALPNRAAFTSHLAELLSECRQSGRRGALLLVDIDHFKDANDTLGHVGGDYVLQHYAERLGSLVDLGDMVARVGGDEFAILCPDINDGPSAQLLVQAITQGMRLPMVYDGRTVDGRSSIGIALYPAHGADSDALTRAADLALQASKRNGRDRFTIFDAALALEAGRHEQALTAAHAAIRDGRAKVYYQPIVTLDDGKIQGLEALLRWTLPTGELVLPGIWSEAFDDPQLAPAISRCVLDQVLRDVADWLAAGVPFGHVAINAGTLDFSCGTFTEDLLGSMAMRQLPPEAIKIEVTEMVLLGRSNGQVARALTALDECGIRIALDDFGTGYASLVHLKRYPIDTVKIDGSFVAGLNSNADDRAIVKSVISLARDLGIKSVAEGIETAAQVAFLRAQGCDFGQGFLFSEALPAEQISQLIARSSFGNTLAG